MLPKRLVVGVGAVVLVFGSMFGIACDDDDEDNGNGISDPVATDTLDDTGDDTGDDDAGDDDTEE